MMSAFDFSAYVRRFSSASGEDDLYSILDDLTRELGFKQFALGHNIDLARPPADAIRLTSYDPDWVERVAEQGYLLDDPIHAASMKSLTNGDALWPS